MQRCKACRRPLTNDLSKRYGFGPDCLKRAVEEGTAPLESLEEYKAFKKQRIPKAKQDQPAVERCEHTLDMFDTPNQHALNELYEVAAKCRLLGINVRIEVLHDQ